MCEGVGNGVQGKQREYRVANEENMLISVAGFVRSRRKRGKDV